MNTTITPGLRFVITGCARSGTKYTAQMLTLGGILTGHEDVFNRWNDDYGLPEDWSTDAVDGDSSFLAAPHAAALAEAGLTVVHLVREPLDVIASVVAEGMLADLTIPYAAYVAAHVPDVAEQPPGPRRAAAYWLGWNALAEDHADYTWRTGQVDEADVRALATAAGVKFVRTRVREALARVSTATNHRNATTVVDVDDLGPLAEDVLDAAERYGVVLTSGVARRLFEVGLVTEDEARRDAGTLDDGTEPVSRTEAGA